MFAFMGGLNYNRRSLREREWDTFVRRLFSWFRQREHKEVSTTQIIAGGFFAAIVIGTILLYLPISTVAGKTTGLIDALFTATTSVCVTGLVTVPTFSQWTIFGQAVILILAQIGGLGVVTFTTIFLMTLRKRIGLKERLLIQSAYNLDTMQGMVRLIQRIIKGTLIVEGIGALLYMLVLVPKFGPSGIWKSVFNSVSAFCNAGMDIMGPDSLESFVTHPLMNFVTISLIILGGLGFPVWWNIMEAIKYNRNDYVSRRSALHHMRLNTKIVLAMTAGLLLLGMIVVLALEYNNPATLGPMAWYEKMGAALFQSVTTRTAGFASISQSGMRESTSFFCCLLMFIGGSPSGTAGGIKTTTIAVLLMTVFSIVRGRKDTEMFERKVSPENVRKALSIFMVSFCAMLLSVLALSIAQPETSFIDCLYESVSAIATVGLSRDLTSTLSIAGKIVIIISMYLGRIGPISLALFFNAKKFINLRTYKEENVSIG